jgi:hypothetical protein
MSIVIHPFLIAATVAAAPLPLRSPLQDKNFFVLSVLERTPLQDDDLAAIASNTRAALQNALATCGVDALCFASGLRLSDDQIEQAAAALQRHGAATGAALRRSGAYVRYDAKNDDELLAAAWRDAAHAINNVIDVYGTGKPPRYAAIDAASFDVKAQSYGQMVNTVVAAISEEKLPLFFQPSLRFALGLLQINNRDEAGRHEPLQTRENAAAVRRIAGIPWKRFPYSVIVVPGAGGDRANWRLSPASKLRLEIAARRYREHKAPLIIVSGGYVHPNQTQYSEAIEMKRSLVADFGVPADAILVDPHARHTTTNLRNAARLMYRYRVPFDRTALITTDGFQSAYIEGEVFAKRCDEELGYRPAQILRRRSRFDLEFKPRVESLQIDAMDPLDP